MTLRIPQSTAKTAVFQALQSSDHVTPATGKTIAITLSINGDNLPIFEAARELTVTTGSPHRIAVGVARSVRRG